MRLLIVDHNPLDSSVIRSLYGRLGEMRGITLKVVVPSRWWNNYEMLRYDDTSWGSLSPAASRTIFSTRTHRLLYRGLRRHLTGFKPDMVYVNAEPENFQTLKVALLCSRYRIPCEFSSWRTIDHRLSAVAFFGEIDHGQRYFEDR